MYFGTGDGGDMIFGLWWMMMEKGGVRFLKWMSGLTTSRDYDSIYHPLR